MASYLFPEPVEATLKTLCVALDAVDIGVLLLDPDMQLRYINRRLAEIYALSAKERLVAGWRLRDLLAHAAANKVFAVPPAEAPDYPTRQEAAVRAGPIAPAEVDLNDGRRLLFSCAVCADGGRILAYVDISRQLRHEADEAVVQISAEMRFGTETLQEQAASLAALAEAADQSARAAEVARHALEREVAERCQLEAQLRRMATTDGLTGALNRAGFLAAGLRAMEEARQSGQGLAMLMLDVDHFKAINDRYGHAGGDLALQHLVRTLHSESRPTDLIGRLGGEEFAVVLPGASIRAAGRVAERLRARIAADRLAYGTSFIEMTVSVGLSVQQATDRSIEQIIVRADAALYRAKDAGRNRVAVEQHSAAA